MARKIHLDSNRKNKQFKVIDFSLRDFSKLENEIFGFEHDKVTNFIGSLEEAVGGTLFLKNIDKMNKKMQGKFLRVFEEKNFIELEGPLL